MGTTTPWGTADSAKDIAPGIVLYTTPSHGGFHVSPKRLEEMPEPLRKYSTFAGRGWYEEDCDASIVVLAFPDLFSAEMVFAAVRQTRSATWTGWPAVRIWLESDDPRAGVVRIRAAAFAEGVKDLWEVGSLFTLPHEPAKAPRKGWGVSLYRGKEHRCVEIPDDQYGKRWYTTAELDALPAL